MDPYSAYAELYCQSNFSFLVGASHPEELIRRAAFLGYSALAITDECSLAGVVRAHSCIKQEKLNIKLIIGSKLCYQQLGLILLCPNKLAYSELSRIISNARRRAVKGRYQLDLWDLRNIRHCIILWLPSGDHDADQHWGEWLQQRYPGRVQLAYQRLLTAREVHYLPYCLKLQQQFEFPACACGGVLMHSPERQPLQHTLTAIRLGQTIAQLGQQLSSNKEAHLRSPEKLSRLYPLSFLQQASAIAASCQFDLSELKFQHPKELVPEGVEACQHLRNLVQQGEKIRFGQTTPSAIKDILEKELSLIKVMAYEYFFLTIYDLVQFAKRQGILYQGRGSAANSIVCYCLEITAVNPEKISVLFERFISKERNQPPDIDVDFESDRREEVIQYIYQKYGRQRAALAATVISFRLKSALREGGKALGFSALQLDYFIKNINRRDATPWPQQLAEFGLDLDSPDSQQLIAIVEQLRGCPRHLSQHVGGFIISAGPLYELVPIENASMADRTVIQWDKDDLESLGLLKADVLSLGMLSAIRRSLAMIKTEHGASISIASITALADDPKVYKRIQQADTVGVFQIESRAQMSMLPRLRPRCYYDLVVQIALIRPGPIQGDMVHPYLRRRNGDEQADYPSEDLRPVLERTHGVPIFQEQVIQIAMIAAGFSGGEADELRRAMGSWKKNGQLHGFHKKLTQGMLAKGYDLDYAERIFQQICGFGEYGFPESHSASFAILAYVSAWLKYYYPAEFYCGLLNSQPMGFYSPSQLIQDAKRHQITILAVCINQSQADHCLQNGALRLGFRIVKGLSKQQALQIEQQRGPAGFSHINQLKLIMSKPSLEALASANALSCLEANRFQARWSLADREQELPLFQQLLSDHQLANQPQAVDDLLEDYASLGLSLEHHPITLLRQQGLFTDCLNAEQLIHQNNGSLASVAGLVSGRQSPGTAGGVTFMTLEDETGQINVIVWAATAKAQRQAFLRSKILRVNGILEKADGVVHIIAGKLIDYSIELDNLSSSSRDFH